MSIFEGDFWSDIINNWEFQAVFKLLLATSLGYLIGYERNSKNKAVGARSSILIIVSAALLTVLSVDGFKEFIDDERLVSDPALLAVGLLIGVGFIGAGSVMRSDSKRGIFGITTAFSVWIMSAIGIAVGLSQYTLAIVATLIVFFVLRIPKKPSKELEKKK